MPLSVNNGVVITTKNYKETLELKTHPIGTIFITLSEDNPADLFGGDWAKIVGKSIMGAAPEDGSFTTTSMIQTSEGYWCYVDGGGNHYSMRVGTEAGVPNISLGISELPSHAHPGVYVNNTGLSCGVGSGVDGFLRLTSTTSVGSINSELRTGYVGGGRAFSILSPYIAAYIWKRIA